MTDRELMEQALEALQIGDEWAPTVIAAITALSKRLEQPEMIPAFRTSHAYTIGFKDGQATRPEPAAWLVQYKNKHEVVWGHKPQWVTDDVLGIEPLYTAQQHQQELDEWMILQSRLLQAEGIIDKFLKSEQSSENEILNSTTHLNTLSCGCKSQYQGFPSEWDTYTREGDNAVAHGVLCEQHFYEYDARPAQKGS